ncbi:NTP transferase domain-containing protein [Dactylosporangium sp. NPDC000244]|uniref:molybdenum cofactor guanylyltransferase n=1 Tax=Dactylosporangium sp. NPDC000244 TaxID=3154365 RepID=UPI0033210A8A
MLDGQLGTLAAVILAGGRASRLHGRDKPMIAVGGVPMLTRVVGAAVEAGAAPVVVVGPDRDETPAGVRVVREEPAGGGPVAAAAAGMAAIEPVGVVALLASDLPYMSAPALLVLMDALGNADGALFVDEHGRRQLLCGVWNRTALRGAIDAFGDTGGGSLRRLVRDLDVVEVRWDGEKAPYVDCDTEEDLRRVGL